MRKQSERNKLIAKLDKMNGIKKMKDKPSRGPIGKELEKLVKQIVKLRDNYTCQKCGNEVVGTNCHASHVIPVSAGNKLKWDEQNMKVLCYHHHINWWHKEPTASGDWFKKKFPERWKYLEANKGIKQFSMDELIEMRSRLQKRLIEVGRDLEIANGAR